MDIRKGYTFDDVLLVPKYSDIISRSDVDLSVDLGKNIKLKIPIISANMKDITGPRMAAAIAGLGGIGLLHRFSTMPEQIDMLQEANRLCKTSYDQKFIGCSIGVKEEDKEIAKTLIAYGCKIICIDIAHGYSKQCLDMTEFLASNFPEVLLIVGNVATGNAVRKLYKCGANVIKCGIGSGSLCSTRIETGNGVPQLTALEDCYTELQYINDKNIKIIADGGLKNAGDCVKALVFSHLIMLGNILAGTDESPGKTIRMNSVLYKEYNGSSTYKPKHIEGVKGLVPIKGSVSNVITKLLEGIKSGCSYQGAHNLQELKTNPQFIQISNAGWNESNPHSIIM